MVLINRKIAAACSLMVLIICLSLPQSVCPQEDPGLDEILNGFEDDQKSNDDLQNALDGFDHQLLLKLVSMLFIHIPVSEWDCMIPHLYSEV